MFTGKYPYFKIKPTMEKELINAYENLAKSSEQLIQLQVQRIAQGSCRKINDIIRRNYCNS